jgi:Trypsin-like peptidase domain
VGARSVECSARSRRRRFGAVPSYCAWRQQLFFILVLVLASSRVEAGCVDPATLAHSTVSITRHFGAEESEARSGLLGIRGTGWFISPTSIVTVEHVAASMKLSDQDWKEVELRNEEYTQSIAARVQRLAGSRTERISVLELKTAAAGAEGVPLRMEPLIPEEPLVSLAYPGGRLRVAGGRFVHYGDSDRFAGAALLEMYDGDDRLVLDHGASGAPVLDCTGRVVAVVSNLFTTTMRFMSNVIRTSTAWGSPNVLSVPVSVLKDSRVK